MRQFLPLGSILYDQSARAVRKVHKVIARPFVLGGADQMWLQRSKIRPPIFASSYAVIGPDLIAARVQS